MEGPWKPAQPGGKGHGYGDGSGGLGQTAQLGADSPPFLEKFTIYWPVPASQRLR